ncbi:MAG: T9SS type A sorting domain-containing protein [Bacteriodetes bacterium]|nr:T9SS type A sorting domain-containing protein [Bacteroidota bacterium]
MDAVKILLWISCVISVFLYGCNDTTTANIGDTYFESCGVFPNPFQDSVIIGYKIQGANADKVTLDIYSENGTKILTYTSPSNDSTNIAVFRTNSYPWKQGYSECWWNSSSDLGQVPNGVYYYYLTLHNGSTELSKKSGTIIRSRK